MRRIRNFYRLFFYICLMTSSLYITSCSDDKSPEDQIHEFIETAKTAAQERSLSDFNALISDSFMGKNGYQKRDISRLAAGYFFRNKNIHLMTKTKTIYFPDPEQAEVQLIVAMAGQPINDAASILNIRAKIYKFDLALNKENGEWLLQNARWSPAESKDLF